MNESKEAITWRMVLGLASGMNLELLAAKLCTNAGTADFHRRPLGLYIEELPKIDGTIWVPKASPSRTMFVATACKTLHCRPLLPPLAFPLLLGLEPVPRLRPRGWPLPLFGFGP